MCGAPDHTKWLSWPPVYSYTVPASIVYPGWEHCDAGASTGFHEEEEKNVK